MPWKFQMRARTDRKEASRSMSKAIRVQERSTYTPPEGGGNGKPPRPMHVRLTAADDLGSQPESQPEGSSHPHKRAAVRWSTSSQGAPSSGRRRLNPNYLERPRGRRASLPPVKLSKGGRGSNPRSNRTLTCGPTAGRATMTST